MQLSLFFGEHVGRDAAGDPVDPAVDVSTELLTRGFQLREGVVRVEQVGVLGDQVGLGDLDRRLAATLGSRVARLTGVDGHRVMPRERNHRGVADRDPGDVPGRDGLLVVGQQALVGGAHAVNGERGEDDLPRVSVRFSLGTGQPEGACVQGGGVSSSAARLISGTSVTLSNSADMSVRSLLAGMSSQLPGWRALPLFSNNTHSSRSGVVSIPATARSSLHQCMVCT